MAKIKYERYKLGELETNCYLLWEENSKEAVLIDPADDGVELADEIQAKGLKLKYILATHGHFDHMLGALDLKLIFNVPFGCSSKDMFLLERQNATASHFLKKHIETPNIESIDLDLDRLKELWLGDQQIEIIKTPGHTPGGVCFYLPKEAILFSGDTIFAHSRGSTEHGYSSSKEIYKSIGVLVKLPGETIILPGHGEETTVGTEREIYSF